MSVFDMLPKGINEAEAEYQEQPQGSNMAVNEIDQIQRDLIKLKNSL